MNFGVAILILKMEENTQHFWNIISYFMKGKTQLKCKKKICAVYGEGAVTDWTCQKWFVKFPARDFLLENAPWLGRSVEVDSDQIETLIENNQYSTKISTSVKLLLKIKNVSFILQKNLNRLFDQPSI